MQKNVLQLIGSFHQGGSERQAVQLCRILQKTELSGFLPRRLIARKFRVTKSNH